MKNISLKLQQSLLEETEEILKELHLSRNRYINEAVEFYNKVQRRKMIEARMIKESGLVSKDSMEVLKEFERLEDER
jgi:metal-responsive CopG/Arc/MetJ family transcriptional regulator